MKKRIIIWMSLLCIIFTYTACSKVSNKSNDNPKNDDPDIYTESKLFELADEIFIEEVTTSTLDLHYKVAHPENYGIEHFEPTFGTYYTEDSTRESNELCDKYLDELGRYDYASLSDEGKLIYDIIDDFIRKIKVMNDYEFYYEPLAPSSGYQSTLPILLAEYQFYVKEDITDYIKLLNDMPRHFDEVIEHQRAKSESGFFMSDATADQIIEQCNVFIEDPEGNLLIECFDERVDAFAGLSDDEAASLKEDNRDAVLNAVIPSYKALIEALEGLKGSGTNEGGLANYDKGREYFELYVKYRTGSSKNISEIKKMLDDKMTASMNAMMGILIKDANILTKMERATFPSDDPREIIELLKGSITDDFPHLDDVNYTIKYVPDALKDFLNPAMYLISPIDAYHDNLIYINTAKESESFFTTMAHESYPGHLYQNVYFLSSNPRLIQTLIGTTGYSEGWGLYTEIYSYAYAGFEENLARLFQYNAEYTYCLYALSDIGIHYDNWTVDKYMEFWAGYGVEDEGMREFYQYMVTEPGVYLPYVVGYLEFMDARETASNKLGSKFDLKEFHQFLLDVGPVPFDILGKKMEEWMKVASQ